MTPPDFSKYHNIDQDNEEMARNISRVIDEFKENPESWDSMAMGDEGAAREKILNRVLFSINHPESKRKHSFRKIASLSAAAVLIIGLSIGFLFKDEILDQLVTYPQVIATTTGTEREKITLPDGSVVTLNGGTRLSYPQHFKHKLREVTLLEGEAYFEVKHDVEKPFQVKAGKTLTHVLGTAFNISSYSWLQTINITVTSGKVAVNNEMLLPNQQLVYDKASAKLQKKMLLASNVTSWLQGGLAFSDERFKTVAAILERKYKVSIDFANQEMEDFHFTANYGPTDGLFVILDDLTMTRGLSYEINQNKIIIKN